MAMGREEIGRGYGAAVITDHFNGPGRAIGPVCVSVSGQ